jgi:hypothetical protein
VQWVDSPGPPPLKPPQQRERCPVWTRTWPTSIRLPAPHYCGMCPPLPAQLGRLSRVFAPDAHGSSSGLRAFRVARAALSLQTPGDGQVRLEREAPRPTVRLGTQKSIVSTSPRNQGAHQHCGNLRFGLSSMQTLGNETQHPGFDQSIPHYRPRVNSDVRANRLSPRSSTQPNFRPAPTSD